MNRKQHIAAAAQHIDAVMIYGHGYTYYDHGTGSWWISSADDIAALGKMLTSPDADSDTYSLWCAGHLAREMRRGYMSSRRKAAA